MAVKPNPPAHIPSGTVAPEGNPTVVDGGYRILPHDTDGVNSSAHPSDTEGGAGARALAQLALSDCGAVAALRLTRRDPARIAAVVYGDDVLDEGSPIALAVGRQLEAALKRNNFARFRESLERAGRLADPARARILDIDAAVPGSDPAALAERVRRTRDLLLRAARGDPGVPDVLWHPHLTLAVTPTLRVTIIPDYLLLRHTAPGFRIGEVKAYRDRGAYTGITSLRLARLQAAVEVIAVQETLRTLGIRAATELVPTDVDFMLRSRTGFFGVVRPKPARVHREVERVRRAITEATLRLPGLVGALPVGASLDTRAGFEALPYHYTEGCRGHCPLAARCAQRAAAAGQPSVLGDEMDAVMGGALTLTDLDAILGGRIAPLTAEAAAVADAFAHSLTAAGFYRQRPSNEVRRAS